MKKSKTSSKVVPNKWMNSMFEMEREQEARRGFGKLTAGRAGKLIPHFTGKAVIEKAMEIHKELIRKIKLVHTS